MKQELRPDEKGKASLTLGDVIRQTKDNYPDPRFVPKYMNKHHITQSPALTLLLIVFGLRQMVLAQNRN